MTNTLILITFIVYSVILFIISWWTGRKATNATFFIGDKSSPWFVVSYGMIGASLSGVTFISIPGTVGAEGFSYMMIVIGYLIGYFVIANVLLPIYYKLNLTSIYTYLHTRFGIVSYKTGAIFFLISRLIGASFRMFLVIYILQKFMLDSLGVPFIVTTLGFVVLILIYTFKAGVKTIVWTDTLQTTFMLASLIFTIFYISNSLDKSVLELFQEINTKGFTDMVDTDFKSKNFFLKQFLSGAFIAIVMTGLDQDMMQKNLSCRNLKDAQKNMITLSWFLVFVNLIFLILGGFLLLYANTYGIKISGTSDNLFPTLALQHFGIIGALIFIIGLISAAYSSADGAMTSLTTSFSIDILGVDRKSNISPKRAIQIRKQVHFGTALVTALVILGYSLINDQAIITKLFTIAGYTYGPLLGLFSFGILSKRSINDYLVPLIAIVAISFSYLLKMISPQIFNGYEIGFELLIINGLLMYLGLWLISIKKTDAL
jgi:Na+/proline symporter